MQVGKAELIPLSRQLDDGPTAPTRYVRAVLIRASNRSTLATINLTDNGEGDFSNYSKTPLMLGIERDEYIEAIYSVYKDALYTQRDTLRYMTVKEVFVVKESNSGTILGQGLRTSGESGLDLGELADEIVKRIFKFNKWAEIKIKTSFAKKFIALTEKSSSEEIKSAMTEIKKIMKESNDALTKTIEQLAELVREQGKAVIDDLSKQIKGLESESEEDEKKPDWDSFEAQMKEYKGMLEAIDKKVGEIDNEGTDLSSLEKALEEVGKKLTERITKEDSRTLKMLKINKGYRKDVRKNLLDIQLDVASILSKIK